MSNFVVADNPRFVPFAEYTILLCVKVLLMSFLTLRQRFKKGAFANPEDGLGVGKKYLKYDDPDVERVRRAHLNDLENIPFFIIIAFLFITVGPEERLPTLFMTKLLLITFTIARVIHTVVYAIVVLPQPARGLSWAVGLLATFYMVVSAFYRVLILSISPLLY